MNNVNKTLYIPLYGKALVSKKGILLHDPKAEEIWKKEEFLLKGKSRSKWLAYNMGMRSAVFDEWVRKKQEEQKSAVVLHLGCGMDSRCCRIHPKGMTGHESGLCGGQGEMTDGHRQEALWYDIDFPEVIEQRRKYYEENEWYRMLGTDVRNLKWLKELPSGNAIVIMEGVSMYMQPRELLRLMAALRKHFQKVSLLMDCYTVFAAKMSKYKNPVNEVGVTTLFGIDEPGKLEKSGLSYVKEHDLTPAGLVNELEGLERSFFRLMFAGKAAKKFYRLYEFKGE